MMDSPRENQNRSLCSEPLFRNDKRCCCGKLLAKQTDAAIVIRCSRCKQEMVIELSRISRRYTPI
ncbi:MAG: hypothetical protein KKF12_04665 [Proteobacteria bacterium]|nr:hypothetical protein [Desulfobacula sp.]MBU3953156.1 hypothetical protein [Pseudomonadota bacterium]MBU4130092.1 hypothetical protein [Pseudomonadota bacterium]